MRLTFVGCGEPDPSVVANAPATSATFALAALAALVISALRPPSRACDCVAVEQLRFSSWVAAHAGPAMALTSAVVFALDGANLIDKVAMITEGQLSGLVNDGLVVGEASPEAAAGGPLAYVENGDTISIDVTRKVVDLEVPEAVLAERRKTPRTFGAQGERGWLRVYQRTVSPVHEGAVLRR